MHGLQSLPPDVRAQLCRVLLQLRREARVNAETSWRRHKAPMAAYWKAVSVYAGHLARALRVTRVPGTVTIERSARHVDTH